MALFLNSAVTWGGSVGGVTGATAGVTGPGVAGGAGGFAGGTSPSPLLTGTVSSDPQDASSLQLISYVAEVSANGGTTVAGALQIQGSNDVTTPTNWVNVGSTTAVSVASGTTVYSASASSFPFRWVRLQFTFTSGGSAGTMTAQTCHKGTANNG